MNKIPEELIQQVPEWSFATLWKHFKLLQPNKQVLNKVKNGIKLKFPISRIIYETYDEFPINNTIRVHGIGEVDYDEFLDEIDERQETILNYIYENYNNDITKSRVEE